MRPLAVASLATLLSAAIAAAQGPAPPDQAEHHTFVMDQFTFESGATVPQ